MLSDEIHIGYPGEPDYRKIARESYNYAIMNGSTDGLEESSCLDPEFAYLYAKNILKEPSASTREAACKSPNFAYWYANLVDREFTPMTYESACHDPVFKLMYESRFSVESPI